VGGEVNDKAAFQGFFEEFLRRKFKLNAEHDTAAADGGDFGGNAGFFGKAGEGKFAECVDVIEEFFLFDDVEDGFCDGHADGVAAEGAAMGSGDHEVGEIGFSEHDADGETAADGFAEGHDVGCDDPPTAPGEVLVSEPFSGSAAAGPDLVEDECEAELVAEVADALGVVGGVEVDAAFALDGFDDDRGGFGIDSGGKFVEVAGVNLNEAGREGIKADFDLGIAGGGEHGEGSAMEALVEGDDLVAARGGVFVAEACEFAGGFVGFEAAVAEEGFAGEGEAVHAFGDFDLGFGVIGVSDMPEFMCLGIGGVDEGGVAVAENGGAEACEEVDVASAVGVEEERTFAAGHDDGLSGVVLDQDIAGAIEDLLSLGHCIGTSALCVGGR